MDKTHNVVAGGILLFPDLLFHSFLLHKTTFLTKLQPWIPRVHPDLQNMKLLTDMIFFVSAVERRDIIKISLKRSWSHAVSTFKYHHYRATKRCVCNRKSSLQYISKKLHLNQLIVISVWLLISTFSFNTGISCRETLIWICDLQARPCRMTVYPCNTVELQLCQLFW